MKKILTRLALTVFVLQATIAYFPYSANAVDTQTALMCRTAKLAMRTQVDNLNRSRTTAWASHWKQYSQLLVDSFSTSVATQRLSIVKSMWTNVNAIQKSYVPDINTIPSGGGRGGDLEESIGGSASNQTQLISPIISQIQSALSA